MFYELRRYRIAAGQMPLMHHRMQKVLMPLFQRCGIPRPVGVWEATAGPRLPLFVWMLRWPDHQTRDAAWASFYPAWGPARLASLDGPEFVVRTGISLLKPWPGTPETGSLMGDGIDELWIQNVAVTHAATARDSFLGVDRTVLAAHGAVMKAGFDFMVGDELPQNAVLLSWPDQDARAQGIRVYEVAAEVGEQRMRDRQVTQIPVDPADRYLLSPASYL